MADLSPIPDSNGDTGTPRWVKVFGIVALVVILLFVILLFTRSSHGPGRHLGGNINHTSSSGVTENGVQQS